MKVNFLLKNGKTVKMACSNFNLAMEEGKIIGYDFDESEPRLGKTLYYLDPNQIASISFAGRRKAFDHFSLNGKMVF